jgi:hypothetical protein
METDKRVAENLAWLARGVEEMHAGLTTALDELSASASALAAEEFYQAHILGALVSALARSEDDGCLKNPDVQDDVVAVAYQIGRKMSLYKLRMLDRNGG